MTTTGQGDALGLSPTLPATPGPAGADAAALAPGQRVGDYVIDAPLGAGAMGSVYAGHHPVIGKRVAIKVLHGQLAASADAATRLVREAQAVNQVDHPGVVDVFAYGRLDDGRTYLVMDLIEGETVRARLRRGPLPPALAIAVIDAVAQALDAAHGRGVIHRDLKPDNVMMREGPPLTVKVLDFGIAKLRPQAGAPSTATLTAQGSWMGTPAYMAPEQWSADGATAASDRYALGVMAYELLTGRPPFQAANVPALMEAHFRAAVPTASGQGRALPAAVDQVLATALAKDPDQRPATAQALADALRAAVEGEPRSTPTGPRRGANPALWAGGVVAIGAVGLGAYLLLAGGPAPRQARAGASAPPTAGGQVEVLSSPPGAMVHRPGATPMLTPAHLPVPAGTAVDIEVRKPGYAPLRRQVAAGAEVVEVRLTPVVQFEGVWALPSGELRRFRREGEVVVAYRLGAADEAGAFYRRFEFVDQGGSAVVWTAEENFVDARAPAEPTCNVPLRAEYVYDPGGDELELRRERVQLDLVAGKCVPLAHDWAPPEPLQRVVGEGGAWAESRAGGAAPVVATPPSVRDDGPSRGNDVATPTPTTDGPGPAPPRTGKRRPPTPPPVTSTDLKQTTTRDPTRDTIPATRSKSPPPTKRVEAGPAPAQPAQQSVPSPRQEPAPAPGKKGGAPRVQVKQVQAD